MSIEPAKAEVKINYVVYTFVVKLEQLFEKRHEGGAGENAIFSSTSLGWYVLLDGSREHLHLGMERPHLNVGDRIKVTFEKVET